MLQRLKHSILLHLLIFKTIREIFIYSFNEDATGKKLYTNIQNTVDTVQKLGVDYVFLVAHLGMNGITPRWSSLAVAQKYTRY